MFGLRDSVRVRLEFELVFRVWVRVGVRVRNSFDVVVAAFSGVAFISYWGGG